MNNEVNNHGEWDRDSIDSTVSSERSVPGKKRPRSLNFLWRPNSLANLVSKKPTDKVLNAVSSADNVSHSSHNSDSTSSPVTPNGERSIPTTPNSKKIFRRGWNTIVTVVIVEAKGLPDPRTDDASHTLYCKIRLGSESFKTKTVPGSRNPEWRERLKLHLNKDHLLRISVWDKGKQKNFMGSCVVDLSILEKERTHELWQELDDGFGSVHMNVTMCTIRDNVITPVSDQNLKEVEEKFAIYNLKDDWKTVGQLHVKLLGAKGFTGKPNAYCTLELDNERVQTPSARMSNEPEWNKSYVFNVYDVTSILDVRVYDNSIVTSLRNESLGKVLIPLLRIHNGEAHWYALKDRNKRNNAKGNCPRILLEMSLIWNPVKATVRLFKPKEVKYIKKPPKFDIALVYSNLEFIRDTFNFLVEVNESLKRLFEWDNREFSSVALVMWLVFWYHIRLWTAPLLLLIPFIYFWAFGQNQEGRSFMRVYNNNKEEVAHNDRNKNEKSLTGRIHGLPEMTLIITNGIEFIASIVERMYNLVTFKVPYLSYVTMLLLVGASFVLYFISINYIMMALGVFKYGRKHLNPDRRCNNDILDFISRIPDNEELKDWKELSVPEPSHQRNPTNTLVRSISQNT